MPHDNLNLVAILLLILALLIFKPNKKGLDNETQTSEKDNAMVQGRR